MLNKQRYWDDCTLGSLCPLLQMKDRHQEAYWPLKSFHFRFVSGWAPALLGTFGGAPRLNGLEHRDASWGVDRSRLIMTYSDLSHIR